MVRKYLSKNVNFKDSVDEIISGKWDLAVDNVLIRYDSPKWMISSGYKNYKIFTDVKHIKSALGIGKGRHQHNVKYKTLINLPTLLNNPIAVFKEDSGILIIFINDYDKNGNIIKIALKPNSTAMYYETLIDCNYMLSIYGKKNIDNYFKKLATYELIYFNK